MEKKETIFLSKKIFYFILFVNIILLLFTLSNTYSDGYNLRQAQTAIMARNIFYDNFNIFPTRLTFFAPNEGNIIFEFPFIHFLTALTYKFFPISEVNGRFINLIFYVFNGIIFYKIQELIFEKNIAIFTSSLYLTSPLILYLGHAYMPETTMMSFYLLAYYFFIKYKNSAVERDQILMFIFLALGPLLKPPVAILFFPIFLDHIQKNNLKFITKKSFIFSICTLPILAWMIYGKFINSSELSTGSNWNWINVLLGKGSLIDIWSDLNFYKNILSNFMIQYLNPITFVLSIYGILINLRSKNTITRFHINWILANLLFLFIFAGANKGHPYYQIFFIPNLIYFIGISLLKIKDSHSIVKKLIINIILLLNLSLSIAVFIYGSNEKMRISNLEEFKSVVNEKITIKKDKSSEYILFANEGLASAAIYTYYADSYSKLFSVRDNDLNNLKNEISSGAKYIFFLNTSYGNTLINFKNNKEVFDWLNLNKEKLYESKSMILYDLA